MSTARTFSALLEAFFTDRLVRQRQASPHTLASYRDTFCILLAFAQQKLRALQLITDHVVPGRWQEVRAPNDLELKQSSVLAVALQEVSAKIRRGPPLDDEPDYALPIWAGVLPVQTRLGAPIDDGRVLPQAARVNRSRFQSCRGRFADPA